MSVNITAHTYGNNSTTYTATCPCGWTGTERPRLKAAQADKQKHDKKDHQ